MRRQSAIYAERNSRRFVSCVPSFALFISIPVYDSPCTAAVAFYFEDVFPSLAFRRLSLVSDRFSKHASKLLKLCPLLFMKPWPFLVWPGLFGSSFFFSPEGGFVSSSSRDVTFCDVHTAERVKKMRGGPSCAMPRPPCHASPKGALVLLSYRRAQLIRSIMHILLRHFVLGSPYVPNRRKEPYSS